MERKIKIGKNIGLNYQGNGLTTDTIFQLFSNG